jgi:hypothetical protein
MSSWFQKYVTVCPYSLGLEHIATSRFATLQTPTRTDERPRIIIVGISRVYF